MAGPLGWGTWVLPRGAAAERCAWCARAGSGVPLGCAGTRVSAAVLKGQLPDGCGTAQGRGKVLPAGSAWWGGRTLAPVSLLPALRSLIREGGWRWQPRRGALPRSGPGGGGGRSGRGAVKLARPGRRGAERPLPLPPPPLLPPGCCSAACSLARSRGPRPARGSPDTGTRRAQPHSPPEGGAALGPKKPWFCAPLLGPHRTRPPSTPALGAPALPCLLLSGDPPTLRPRGAPLVGRRLTATSGPAPPGHTEIPASL
ncbi:hypothetical protein LEMLEM_LOCUS21856 [Lemmus lemmus]